MPDKDECPVTILAPAKWWRQALAGGTEHWPRHLRHEVVAALREVDEGACS